MALAIPTGSEHDDELHSSPRHQLAATSSTPHSTSTAAATAYKQEKPTPGQRVAQQQAEILQKEKFEQTYGLGTVAKWDINWAVFSENRDDPFTSQKRQNIKKLLSHLLQEETSTDDSLLNQVAVMKARMDAVHPTRLQAVMEGEFKRRYPEARNISFNAKSGGDQMGTVITIELDADEKHRYFVKTHARGRKESQSTAAKTVDPKELLVYKILENLGVGCQALFCARSPEDVYIATLDAAKEGDFYTFDKFVNSSERDFGCSLWGSLENIKRPYQENNWERIEQDLMQDPIALNFAYKMATVDILTRLLKLHDLLNNSENYGFIKTLKTDNPWDLRVIDFRLSSDDDLRFIADNWRGFLVGNGMFMYASAHKTIAYLLHHRDKNDRVKTARLIMGETLNGFETATEKAYTFVDTYIKEDPAFESQKEELLRMLSSYHSILQQNITVFREMLQSYAPEANNT